MNMILTSTGRLFTNEDFKTTHTLSPFILDKKRISVKIFVLCTSESCKTLEEGSKKLIPRWKYLWPISLQEMSSELVLRKIAKQTYPQG